MSDESDFEVDVRRGRSGFSVRTMVPGALVTALVTAMSTGAVTRCTAPEAKTEALEQKVNQVIMTQTQILEKLNRVDEDARNRDVVQNAAIESLRNR